MAALLRTMEKKVKPRRVESTRVHNNKWGYRGVEWDAARQKFRARIEPANGKRGRFLGRFDTAEEAARAYDAAARQVYGEHAYLNFPGPGELKAVASKLRRGFCPKGHDLSVYGHQNPRQIICRKCNNEAQKRYRAKKAAEEPGPAC